jgi:methionine synthase II (cobalamin-independent)
MAGIEFSCLPTMIGSMPQTDAAEACNQVLHFLKDIPAWPQLPHRSYLEGITFQYSEGFPGLVVQDHKIYVDRSKDLEKSLERLYSAYLDNNIYQFPISAKYAAGLHQFLTYTNLPVKAVKGQIVGPLTWGMTVTDTDQRAIAYDEVLADACARLLKLKASWMEKELRAVSKNTLIFVDEPYLTSIGSSFFALSKEKAFSLLEEVFSGIQGLKGIHCCANTDWGLLLSTRVDILSLDAYNFAESLALYPQEMRSFLNRGGVVAWGIGPNEEATLKQETVSSLQDRLEQAMAPFTRKGVEVPFRQIIKQGLLTPSCGLARLSPEAAASALELLVGLSDKVRRKWG